MAKVRQNEKGFWVIDCSNVEIARVGGFGICDNCGQAHLGEGVYVAVINRWLCPKCYEHWLMGAVNYPEDAYIERKNLRYYATLLKAEV